MVLNEQWLKDHFNRNYYQGRIFNFDKNKKIFKNLFYLTTFLPYAMTYANDDNGIVINYHLNKDINIFNARCKTDYDLIKDKVESSSLLEYVDRLANEDWIFEDDIFDQKTKISFINIIKDLGYDGFFNIEVDKDFIKKLKKHPERYVINRVMVENPCICVFDESCLTEKKILTIEECKKTEQYLKYKNLEKDYIGYRILLLIKNGKYDSDDEKLKLVDSLIYDENLFTYSEDEIKDIIFSYSKDDILFNSDRFLNTFEYLKERQNPYWPIIKTYRSKAYGLYLRLLNENKSDLFDRILKDNF